MRSNALSTIVLPIIILMMLVYGFQWKTPYFGTIKVESDPDKLEKWIRKFGDWFVIEKIEGKDENGNKATFEFYTLFGVNNDYGWEFGSWERIQDGIKNQSIDAEKFLFSKLNQAGMKQRIENSSDIISVGVASCEGSQREEERRAENRAKIIRRSVESIANTTRGELSLLLLGQYDDNSCSAKSPNDTLPQRSIIIIGVVQKDQNVNLKQAVRSAMGNVSRNKNLKRELDKLFRDPSRSPLGSLKLGKYSLFDLRI
ncbi:MAG: hypothetical protein DCF19_11180 [Pseudanabaena frigida]|uniref:Uncharacterized protein n=1 Tax=Pseudanabaena frigida TaxID=945775 RepID=A0A2W4W6V3_9CYAN|nr:MAG: hypothetical protein DCF19_11180 [Pseudanabaena frigida]